MALKRETREINGLEVTSTQLPVLRQYKLMARLGRLLAPALGRIEGLDKLSVTDDVSKLMPALSELFMKLDETELMSLARDLLAGTQVKVEDQLYSLADDKTINNVFAGNLKAMLGSMKFSVEVNFGDFFGDALASVKSDEGTAKASD